MANTAVAATGSTITAGALPIAPGATIRTRRTATTTTAPVRPATRAAGACTVTTAGATPKRTGPRSAPSTCPTARTGRRAAGASRTTTQGSTAATASDHEWVLVEAHDTGAATATASATGATASAVAAIVTTGATDEHVERGAGFGLHRDGDDSAEPSQRRRRTIEVPALASGDLDRDRTDAGGNLELVQAAGRDELLVHIGGTSLHTDGEHRCQGQRHDEQHVEPRS